MTISKNSKLSRKRLMGSRGIISDEYSGFFTEGERAVLSIVIDAQQDQPRLSAKELGEQAGVSVTTVRGAMRKAREIGLLNR